MYGPRVSHLRRARTLALIDSAKAKALLPRATYHQPSDDAYWRRVMIAQLEAITAVGRFCDNPTEVEACRRRRAAYLCLALLTRHKLARYQYFHGAQLWRTYGRSAARYAASMARNGQ